MWRHFCDAISVTFKSQSQHYVICTKSRKFLPNFGFALKRRIDRIDVLQTPIIWAKANVKVENYQVIPHRDNILKSQEESNLDKMIEMHDSFLYHLVKI